MREIELDRQNSRWYRKLHGYPLVDGRSIKCLSSKLLEDCFFFLHFFYQKTELVSCFKELLEMLNISGEDLHIFLSPCIYSSTVTWSFISIFFFSPCYEFNQNRKTGHEAYCNGTFRPFAHGVLYACCHLLVEWKLHRHALSTRF